MDFDSRKLFVAYAWIYRTIYVLPKPLKKNSISFRFMLDVLRQIFTEIFMIIQIMKLSLLHGESGKSSPLLITQNY